MAYADQQMSGNKIVAIVIVAIIHVALGYALITGLAASAFQEVVERVTTVDVSEPPPPPPDEPPPPPPENVAPPPPVAPVPPISIAPRPPDVQTQVTIPPPAPPAVIIPPAAPIAAPAPPPPPPPSQARPLRAEGQNRWARQIQENYPARAIREEASGTVGVSVTVGPNGRVTECSVTSSSGNSSLDAAACDGMRRFARYTPALNAAGTAISANTSTRIVYQLN